MTRSVAAGECVRDLLIGCSEAHGGRRITKEFAMKKKTVGFCVALGLALAASGVSAQTSWKLNCVSSGAGGPETVGEGHVFWVSTAVCTEEGGPLGGAVATQNAIWENIKGTGTLLSGDGVARSPLGAVVYRNNAGTMKMLMKEGKPVGWEASGGGVYTLASGPAASFKGKTFSWTAKATGPRTYVIESKLD